MFMRQNDNKEFWLLFINKFIKNKFIYKIKIKRYLFGQFFKIKNNTIQMIKYNNK